MLRTVQNFCMISLKDYIKEMEGAATPGNTMGMGNPTAPSGDMTGTEPLVTNKTAKFKKEKKKCSETH